MKYCNTCGIDEDKFDKQEDRIRELENLIKEMKNGFREVLWCSLVWNDHNFSYKDLLSHLESARKNFGFERTNLDAANDYMDKINLVLYGKLNEI